MADKTQKQPENVPGRYYVDTTCIASGPCMECANASNVLKWSEDKSHVYFFKQPETEEEIKAANEAIDVCPPQAIGNDGE